MTSDSGSTPTVKKQKGFVLTTPFAIIIAGALIALAVYAGGVGNEAKSTVTANTNTGDTTAKPATTQGIGDIREVSSEDHIRGAEDAKVTIIEYSDFECPFCKRFHPTMQKILTDYPNDVRWVYRHYPLDTLHAKARKEAEATECAGEQGKFWEMTDKIFEVTPSNDGLDLADLPNLAKQAGVKNITQFQSCLDSGKYADHVAEDVTDAQKAGARGTPYSVVIAANGEKSPLNGAQPYESVKQAVEQALAK